MQSIRFLAAALPFKQTRYHKAIHWGTFNYQKAVEKKNTTLKAVKVDLDWPGQCNKKWVAHNTVPYKKKSSGEMYRAGQGKSRPV